MRSTSTPGPATARWALGEFHVVYIVGLVCMFQLGSMWSDARSAGRPLRTAVRTHATVVRTNSGLPSNTAPPSFIMVRAHSETPQHASTNFGDVSFGTEMCVVPTAWVGRPDNLTTPDTTFEMIPGYQGWIRPVSAVPVTAFKLLGDHKVIFASGSRVHAIVGEKVDVRLECNHPNCYDGRVVLGARAMGPSPLRFEVPHTGRSEFTVPFVAFDPGLYKLEVFMLYSSAAKPPSLGDPDNNYEGVSLLSTPLKIDVAALDDPTEACGFGSNAVPTCHARFLWQQPGRWRSVPGNSYTQGVPAMEWFPTRCRLPSATEVRQAQRRIGAVHAVLIGDSLMAQQADDWKQHWRAWSVTSHSTTGSLEFALRGGLISSIDEDVDNAFKQSKRVAILVNAGLHDMAKLCRPVWNHWWADPERGYDQTWLASHTGPEHCVKTYNDAVEKLLVAMVRWRDLGAFVAWRTTTASWQVWGNIHAGFLCGEECRGPATLIDNEVSFTRVSEFARETAVLDKMVAAGIEIVDGWNVTLPRADHAQKGPYAAVVHFGPEVPTTFNRIFVLMAVEHFTTEQQRR